MALRLPDGPAADGHRWGPFTIFEQLLRLVFEPEGLRAGDQPELGWWLRWAVLRWLLKRSAPVLHQPCIAESDQGDAPAVTPELLGRWFGQRGDGVGLGDAIKQAQ